MGLETARLPKKSDLKFTVSFNFINISTAEYFPNFPELCCQLALFQMLLMLKPSAASFSLGETFSYF